MRNPIKFIQNISSTSSIWDSCYCAQTWAGNCVRCFQVPPPRAADMSSETIAMERLAPDQCQSCSRIHSCGRADNPVTESSRVDGSSPLAQSTLRREAQVLPGLYHWQWRRESFLHQKGINRNHYDTDSLHFASHNTAFNLLRNLKVKSEKVSLFGITVKTSI